MKKKLPLSFFAGFVGFFVAAMVYQSQQEGKAERFQRQSLGVANLASGLSSLGQLRLQIETFWYETGELPCPGADVHLSTDFLAFQSPALREVALPDCGELTATFSEASGVEGGTLVFRAREVEAASHRGFEWECLTADYPKIEDHFSSCRYEPSLKEAGASDDGPAKPFDPKDLLPKNYDPDA